MCWVLLCNLGDRLAGVRIGQPHKSARLLRRVVIDLDNDAKIRSYVPRDNLRSLATWSAELMLEQIERSDQQFVRL